MVYLTYLFLKHSGLHVSFLLLFFSSIFLFFQCYIFHCQNTISCLLFPSFAVQVIHLCTFSNSVKPSMVWWATFERFPWIKIQLLRCGQQISFNQGFLPKQPYCGRIQKKGNAIKYVTFWRLSLIWFSLFISLRKIRLRFRI